MDTTNKSIIIKETIRICSDPHTDKDKDIDLQKKETDGTQASKPNKKETNNADSQHKIQIQPWRKEERESTLNKIGKGETNISHLADAIIKESRDCTYQEDKTESKNQNPPPHESEAGNTQRTLEDAYQTHQTEVANNIMRS